MSEPQSKLSAVQEQIDRGLKGMTETAEKRQQMIDAEFDVLKKRIQGVEGVKLELQQTEKWLTEVEARVNTARTHGQNQDGFLDAIPAEYRHHVEIAERVGYKDPGRVAATGLWWHFQYQRKWSLQRDTGRTGQEWQALADNIERAWGYDPRVTKSLSEGTTTQGGMTVATPVEAELYRLIRDFSVVRPLATKIVMAGPTVQLPTEASNITAYIVPESTNITEGTTATASQFGQTALVAKKFAGFAKVTNELLQDNIIGLQDYLMTAIAEHIGILEDQGALDGNTGNFTGLDLTTGINSFTTSNTSSGGDAPTFNELVTAIYSAKQKSSRANGRFVMHPTAFKNVHGMVDTTGQPVFVFGNAPQSMPYFIGGFPVELTSALSLTKTIKTSSTNIYFGPMNKIIFGDIAGMQFDIDPFSNFQNVLTNIRVLKRTGIAIPVPSAFTIIHGAKNS